MATRWWRRPAVHFVAIGSVLFLAKSLFVSGPIDGTPESEAIVVSARRVAELREDWTARTGAAPSAREESALLDALIDDELLIREARRRGYHRSDSVVQRRLLRNMQFVAGDSDRPSAELLEEAYALGMDRTDLVVRRRLVQKMQLAVEGSVRAEEPTRAELLDYMARHEERFEKPPRVRLTHVFLSRDRRGESLEADARATLDRLKRGPVGPEDAASFGDPFLFERSPAPRSERDLAKIFGPDFAARAFTLPTGRWVGPVSSAYGTHLVWVEDRIPEEPTPLAAVEREVRESVFAERGAAALKEYIAELRNRYEVRVESTSPPEGSAP